MQENTAAEDAQAFGTSPDDPVFAAEQAHLSEVYAELEKMRGELVRKMEATSAAAARDKLDLLSEISNDFTSDTETSETYASYGAVNSVIDSYNAQQEVTADKLARCRLLLRQPYFAKVALQFKPGQPPKELYIGAAGISDDNYKRLVVDWRSPVAETYYNQSNGATSYEANGRTIHVDLACRRQFDIEADTLHAYFDTTVAIQDALLLESLSHQRTAQMKAITATIQREQNEVVRHEDVPALLVAGIAGSGKTSVLLQRIAYLFYQNRTELDPSEVFLITPNPIFRTYIENVLPDMGERNPETLTWAEFASRVMPLDKAAEKKSVPVGALWRIDEAIANLEFEDDDFRELHHGNVKLLGINQIRKVNAKYRNVPAGPHRATLMREDLENALEARVKQLASGSAVLEELEGMTLNEQLSQFGEPYAPVDEKEARDFALRLLQDRYQGAFRAVQDDAWLRIDRIGMRLLGEKSLSALEWLYLKMAITGLGDAYAKYVMIDEVQDYSAAQLAVLARFFRRAHFMLLGDENQAINPNTASFAEVREVFTRLRVGISTCSLLTSYRSSPEITEIFAGIPALYVADGHHRTAAAARVGKKRQESNPNHTGNEEYCYFLAVTFPASQLRIIDYNRVVKDLNGMTTEQFLKALEKNFTVEPKGKEIYHPSKLHNFSLYLDGQWYSLTAKPGTYDDNDPIGVLDVTVLSNLVLDQLLDIKDLRTSKRIDFVGGIRGLEELKKRVDSGEMKAAFALYPVSMQQLIDIADTGNIMPPKTTWFEPKLRSGVVIHTFEEK